MNTLVVDTSIQHHYLNMVRRQRHSPSVVNRISALAGEDYINLKAKGEDAKARFVQKNKKAIKAEVAKASEGFLDLTAEVGFKQQHGIVNQKKATALHIAAANCNVAAVTKLLELGAKPDAPIEDGDTPLHLAARKGSKDITQKLLDAKISASTRNRYKCTSLHVAVENSISDSPPGNPTEIEAICETAKLLIRHDKKLTGLCNGDGETALHVAARKGNLAIVKALCQHDPGLLKRHDNRGNTALHLAARNDRLKVVGWLLEQLCNEDVKKKNKDGKTPSDVAKGRSKVKLEDYGR